MNSPKDETALDKKIKQRSLNYRRIYKIDTFTKP